MNQRDFDALQRDFAPLLSAADFALLVAEVDAAPTSFARCNVIANWRKWTHHAREAQIVEAHAVDGVLYGWSEVVEPVQAVDRMRVNWWRSGSLWETGNAHHSPVEYEALDAIRRSVGLKVGRPAATVFDLIAEEGTNLVSEAWGLSLKDLHARHGKSLIYTQRPDGTTCVEEVSLNKAA